MRVFRGISVMNASGIVQQRTAHDFDRPLHVVSDRRKRKHASEEPKFMGGFFWTQLTSALRNSLVEMVRKEVAPARKIARGEKQSHDEEKLQRREEALQRQLINAVEKYAAALELFDQWSTQRVKTAAELNQALADLSEPEQLAELRRQIEMRIVGCGWTQFQTKWSFFANERTHTIAKLRSMLVDDILPHEKALNRMKKLPVQAAPPQLKSHACPQGPRYKGR